MGVVMYYSEPDYSWVLLVMGVAMVVGLVVAYFVIKAAVRNGINESRLFVKPEDPKVVPGKVSEPESSKKNTPAAEVKGSTIWPS